jgi:hypothetical protein
MLVVHVTPGDVTPYICVSAASACRHHHYACYVTRSSSAERLPLNCLEHSPSSVFRYAETESYCMGVFAVLKKSYTILSNVHSSELNITHLCHGHRKLFRSEETEKVTVWQWRTEKVSVAVAYREGYSVTVAYRESYSVAVAYREGYSVAAAYPGILFGGGGGSTNSVEARGQRERRSGGGSPLVRGSTRFANE